MGSLFIIGARIALRSLEVVPASPGQAAVGKNTLQNLFRLDFGEWWQYSISLAGGSRKRMARGGPWGGHGGGDDVECGQESTVKMLLRWRRVAASCAPTFWKRRHAIPGLDQLMSLMGHPAYSTARRSINAYQEHTLSGNLRQRGTGTIAWGIEVTYMSSMRALMV
jgi:hypothetical protein